MRAPDIDFVPFLVPIPGRVYDIFGVGAAIQGGASLASGVEQYEEAQNALNFQQTEYNTQQQNEAPYLQAGQGALSQLTAGTAPGGSLVQPYGQTFNPGTFQAPTGLTEQNDPGFQSRLQLGQQALENSEAGKVSGGGALEAAEQYGQTFATNDYQNVYNDALNTYNANYQSGLGAFDTNYGVYANNQANQYNRLAGLAGTGQTAVAGSNQAGQAAAAGVSNISGELGNALSAGTTGVGNAVNSGISNYTNNQLLQGILAQNANSSGYGTPQATGSDAYSMGMTT